MYIENNADLLLYNGRKTSARYALYKYFCIYSRALRNIQNYILFLYVIFIRKSRR